MLIVVDELEQRESNPCILVSKTNAFTTWLCSFTYLLDVFVEISTNDIILEIAFAGFKDFGQH